MVFRDALNDIGRPGGLFVAIFLPEERGQKGFSLQSLTQNLALSKNAS